MRKLPSLLIACIVVGLLSNACVHYVEEPTPPGHVAEARSWASTAHLGSTTAQAPDCR